MQDLKNSGVVLRNIQPKELGQFSADIMYNFAQLLNSPGFKGRKGDSIVGPPGPSVRGSRWLFVDTTKFFPAYGLSAAEQITLTFMNTALSDNQRKLYDTLDLASIEVLLEFDNVVLPSGDVIQLRLVEDPNNAGTIIPRFEDTGLTFEQSSGITEDRVRAIIAELINNDPDAQDAIFRRFNAVAKNHADSSPALNTSVNTDSAIDIAVSGSGPGAAMNDHTFIASKEQKVNDLTKACLIAGSPQRYHKLIQKTQEDLTNAYIPGVDDFASIVMLQNSYNNGLVFGHRDAGTLRNFGRLYRATDAVVLASSYSPDASSYSQINLKDNEIIVRATKTRIASSELEYVGAKLLTNHFSYDGTVATIGAGVGSRLYIDSRAGVFINHITSAHVLSTDANGMLTKVFSVITDIAAATSNNQLASALSIRNMFRDVDTILDDHDDRIEALETADTSQFYTKQRYFAAGQSVNLNTLTAQGNWAFHQNANASNRPPSMTVQDDWHLSTIQISDQGANVKRVKQTIWCLRDTGSEFLEEYFRFGKATYGGGYAWSAWERLLVRNDVTIAGNGLTSDGGFYGRNYTIHHANRNSQLDGSINFNGGLVPLTMFFDAYGHPTRITSKNLDDRYYTKSQTYSRSEIEALVTASDVRVVSGAIVSNGQWINQYPPGSYTMSHFKGAIVSFNQTFLEGHGYKFNRNYVLQAAYRNIGNRIQYRAYCNDTATHTPTRVNYLSIWQK